MLTFYERHPGLSTEVSGNKLLFYRHGDLVKPDDLKWLLKDSFQILSLLQPAIRP